MGRPCLFLSSMFLGFLGQAVYSANQTCWNFAWIRQPRAFFFPGRFMTDPCPTACIITRGSFPVTINLGPVPFTMTFDLEGGTCVPTHEEDVTEEMKEDADRLGLTQLGCRRGKMSPKVMMEKYRDMVSAEALQMIPEEVFKLDYPDEISGYGCVCDTEKCNQQIPPVDGMGDQAATAEHAMKFMANYTPEENDSWQVALLEAIVSVHPLNPLNDPESDLNPANWEERGAVFFGDLPGDEEEGAGEDLGDTTTPSSVASRPALLSWLHGLVPLLILLNN